MPHDKDLLKTLNADKLFKAAVYKILGEGFHISYKAKNNQRHLIRFMSKARRLEIILRS